MKIGKYNLSTLHTGYIGLDGGAMFGVVPKALWEKTNPPDEKNRITVSTKLLLLESGKRKILVDTGTGENWKEKFTDIYRLDNSEFSMSKSLAEKNISADDITDVIFTHLHFDHAGGSVVKEGDKFVPAFPNAVYHVQEKHLQWAKAPSDKDKASFISERFLPLEEEGLLKLWKGEVQLDDEIMLIPDHGHTFFQQLVKISDGNRTLLHTADLIPLTSHIPLPYIMAYDIMPLETLKHKKELLDKAVEEDWILYFQHDPYFSSASVQRDPKGYSAKEKFNELPND